jgi:hypothetical protein
MRKAVRQYYRRTKLETIHEDQEFLVGPYPQETLFDSGVQLVAVWAEHIFPCWFAGHEDVCAWRL